jgi:hypothetical protein
MLENQLIPITNAEKSLTHEKESKQRKNKKKNFVSHLFGF